MEPTPDSIAREAAGVLAEEFGQPDLPKEVESALATGIQDDVRLDGETVISLAALVVATAQLSVGLYFGLTGKGSTTRAEMQDELGRRLKIQTDAAPEEIEKIVLQTIKALFRKNP
jgi:hypothetical protein